jgi:hypothetical protein
VGTALELPAGSAVEQSTHAVELLADQIPAVPYSSLHVGQPMPAAHQPQPVQRWRRLLARSKRVDPQHRSLLQVAGLELPAVGPQPVVERFDEDLPRQGQCHILWLQREQLGRDPQLLRAACQRPIVASVECECRRSVVSVGTVDGMGATPCAAQRKRTSPWGSEQAAGRVHSATFRKRRASPHLRCRRCSTVSARGRCALQALPGGRLLREGWCSDERRSLAARGRSQQEARAVMLHSIVCARG